MWARAGDWILGSPEETLRSRLIGYISTRATAVILCSALLSVSLAETLIVSGSWTQCLASAFVWTTAFFLWFFLYYRFSRFFSTRIAGLHEWFNAAVLAIVPLHLLLPAALLCRGESAGWLLLYELIKAFVLWSIARRAVAAIETLNGWPGWAAVLLLVSPIVLAGFGCFLIGIITVGGVLLLIGGSVR